MNRYTLITLLSLLAVAIILPVYALREPDRMETAQADLRQQFVGEAAALYVENCAVCHGAQGEGIGATPPLNSDALRAADYDFLDKIISRGLYGTAMAGWHKDEGGIFNDYEIEQLIALIRYGDWPQVRELAAAQGMIPATLPGASIDEASLAQIAALDGENGPRWAEGMDLFANNCTVCHGIDGAGTELGVPLNTPEIRAAEATELVRLINEGVPATAMVGWHNVLAETEIEAIVAFLQNWDTIEGQGIALTPAEPIQIDLDNPEEVLGLGERIFNTTCVSCHGENGSGGTGPALNSQQILTTLNDEQIRTAILNGGRRPMSTMPAFGERLTAVEIDALVQYIRAWEPTAPVVQNPRGTAQGGGPPWLRATPDPDNPVSPGGGQGKGNGRGQGGNGNGGGQGQGGPPWRQEDGSGTPPGQQSNGTTVPGAGTVQGPTLHFSGRVVTVNNNMLTFQDEGGTQIDAMLGPPWFWSESGIPLAPGDQIELEGFESPDHMEVNWLTNHTTGQTIRLRTPDGLPVWSSGSGQ